MEEGSSISILVEVPLQGSQDGRYLQITPEESSQLGKKVFESKQSQSLLKIARILLSISYPRAADVRRIPDVGITEYKSKIMILTFL